MNPVAFMILLPLSLLIFTPIIIFSVLDKTKFSNHHKKIIFASIGAAINFPVLIPVITLVPTTNSAALIISLYFHGVAGLKELVAFYGRLWIFHTVSFAITFALFRAASAMIFYKAKYKDKDPDHSS